MVQSYIKGVGTGLCDIQLATSSVLDAYSLDGLEGLMEQIGKVDELRFPDASDTENEKENAKKLHTLKMLEKYYIE